MKGVLLEKTRRCFIFFLPLANGHSSNDPVQVLKITENNLSTRQVVVRCWLPDHTTAVLLTKPEIIPANQTEIISVSLYAEAWCYSNSRYSSLVGIAEAEPAMPTEAEPASAASLSRQCLPEMPANESRRR